MLTVKENKAENRSKGSFFLSLDFLEKYRLHNLKKNQKYVLSFLIFT